MIIMLTCTKIFDQMHPETHGIYDSLKLDYQMYYQFVATENVTKTTLIFSTHLRLNECDSKLRYDTQLIKCCE